MLTVRSRLAPQEDREATREQFMDRFGPEVRREDLTVMASKVVRVQAPWKKSPMHSLRSRQTVGALQDLPHTRSLLPNVTPPKRLRQPLPLLMHRLCVCGTLALSTQDDPTDQIFVFFPEEPKVGVKTIKVLAERMRNEGVQRAIMVTQANMTPFARQCLTEMAPKYSIELFQEAELLVNITKHSLVPQHRILTKEEKQTLLDRYKVRYPCARS